MQFIWSMSLFISIDFITILLLKWCFFVSADGLVVSATLSPYLYMTNTSILYSTPQPASSEFGCLTVSYLGQGVHLQIYITQGTLYTPDKMVFERRDIDSKLFASTSIQTPTNIPYMVLFVYILLLYWDKENPKQHISKLDLYYIQFIFYRLS